jgi:hypothetical protein
MSKLTILEVDVRAEVHGTSNSLEDQSPLPPGWRGEFNLSVQSSRSQQGGIQRVLSVCSHDDLRN